MFFSSKNNVKITKKSHLEISFFKLQKIEFNYVTQSPFSRGFFLVKISKILEILPNLSIVKEDIFLQSL